MKKVLALTTSALLSLALTGCIEINVNRSPTYPSGDLKAVIVNTQKGEVQGRYPAVEVENSFGTIRVIGTENGPVTWSWKLTAYAQTEEAARESAKLAYCTSEPNGDKLRVIVSLPDTQGKARFESELEIRVPKSMRVATKNRYGRIEISDLAGDVEASSQSGAMEIRNVAGKIHAQTTYAALKVNNCGPATLKNQSGLIEAFGISGRLDAETTYASLVARDIGGPVRLRNQSGRLEAVRCDGPADLKTTYAQLLATDIKGDATILNQSGGVTTERIAGHVKANTSYAAMEIKSAAGSNFILQNQGGDIRLWATSLTVTNVEAKTSYAAVEVHLPKDLKPAVYARTSYAEIESDFPVLGKPGDKPSAAELPIGTPHVSLQTQSGKIRIVRD